jgi:hypothetical protein
MPVVVYFLPNTIKNGVERHHRLYVGGSSISA